MATRIDQLARPKPNLLKFPDRRSVYWLDELPPSLNSSSTAFDLTPRWSKLAESKKLIPNFEDNRQSPGWKLSAAVLKARPSDRVCALALPRMPAAGWQPDRPLLPTVSVAVRTAKANAWICQLARPRKMCAAMTQFCSSEISPSVPSLAKPSPRTHLLATPKQDHPQYCPDRPVSWPVAKPALEAVASERLQVLATPRLRKPLFEGFDPYRVSSAARAATASPRLQELALPPARRCRRR
ncbi:theg spermatid protein [Pygocentrus nattereri]|uniref:Theg spermatid protein n=1 Tax=Pygocentrus nattereri TaxID=42514 RepID=A0AAR2KM26_PYGNA|nr:theg spermatid protein [Pygocentrus nattereri]XP_017552551.1 theg spermatid protein [Pygocentrus nattereri]XP_037387102.1 theg spermatid protein [Pygocentrus nattereri]